MQLISSDDGLPRCWWGAEPEIYRLYHDSGVGTPGDRRPAAVREDLPRRLPGRSVLAHHPSNKRPHFRVGFADFEIEKVAAFGEDGCVPPSRRRRHRPSPGQDPLHHQQRPSAPST